MNARPLDKHGRDKARERYGDVAKKFSENETKHPDWEAESRGPKYEDMTARKKEP